MDESYRFKLVFAKLQELLDADTTKESAKSKAQIRRTGEVTHEELDEIDKFRRIVLEATEPEPMSYTTT